MISLFLMQLPPLITSHQSGHDAATTKALPTSTNGAPDNGDQEDKEEEGEEEGPEEASSNAPHASAVAAIDALAALARNARLQHRPYAVAVAVTVLTRWACFDSGAAVPPLVDALPAGGGKGAGKGKDKKGKHAVVGAGAVAAGGAAAWGLPGLAAAGLSLGPLLDAVRASEGAAAAASGEGG